MLTSGKLYRAEIYVDNTYPYHTVKSVYEEHKNDYPNKKLIVSNSQWWYGTKIVGNLKVDKKVWSQEDNPVLGFFWNNGAIPTMGIGPMTNADNFIGTIPAIYNGTIQEDWVKAFETNQPGVARSCHRTWWGFKKDGTCLHEVSTANYTLRQTVNRMLELGVYNGIVMDGSGSSQYYDGSTYLQGDNRNVLCFLLLWFDQEIVKTPVNTTNKETQVRNAVVSKIKSWKGWSVANGKYKQIIDTYNAHKPLAQGYIVQYTDQWCATTVSAVAISLGITDVMFTECGCERMINLYKAKNRWVENDAYVPSPGDIVFYYWKDGANYATTDCTGFADHVGIVVESGSGRFTVLEGNYQKAVSYRTMEVNGRYIRGFAVPDYGSAKVVPTNTVSTTTTTTKQEDKKVTITVLQLSQGSKNNTVKSLQQLLNAKGFSCGTPDGDFGTNTKKAVVAFQKSKGLTADGVVGATTWNALLS